MAAAKPAPTTKVNLNTATFDKRGRIWFTGQNGVYGRLDPKTGDMQVWDAPRGRGPYGIATTPEGAALAARGLKRIFIEGGGITVSPLSSQISNPRQPAFQAVPCPPIRPTAGGGGIG